MGERRYYNIGMWLAITNYMGAFLICFLEYESGGIGGADDDKGEASA